MNNKKKKKQNGFTIVELVIVIAVIGILAAVLIPTFSNLVKKSKQSADQQLVYHINEAVVANEVDNLAKGKSGTEATMYDTLKKLESDYGFTVEKMTPRSGNDIVWDSTTNRFALVAKDGTVIYTDSNRPTSDMTNKAQMWRITEAGETLGDGYSHYLTAGWTGEVPAVATGLDVGDNDDITAVTYDSSSDASAVVRTNGGTLTVKAPNGTVKHYGEADKVDVQSVAGESYHENGVVKLIAVKKGHVELEGKAEVNGIYVYNDSTATEKDTSFEDIKITVNKGVDVPKFSRSAVEVQPEGTKVCTVVTDQAKDIYLFNEGIYEQIKTVDAGKNVSTDTSATWADNSAKNTENTQTAAMQLANEFNGTYENGKIADQEVTVGETEYTVKFNEETRTFETYQGETKVTDTTVVEAVAEVADVASEAGKTADDAEKASVLKGTGTQTDPFLIYDYETMQYITTISSLYINDYDIVNYYYNLEIDGNWACDTWQDAIDMAKENGYSLSHLNDSPFYFKVKDGTKIIDCNEDNKLWVSVKLYGNFDGNGVTFTNLDSPLFSKLYSQSSTIGNFTADCNIVSQTGRAAICTNSAFNALFHDITVTGYIEGQGQTAAVVSYPGSGVTEFKNVNVSADIVSLGDAGAAAFVINPYKLLSNYGGDSNSKLIFDDCHYSGKMSATGTCKFFYVHTTTVPVEIKNIDSSEYGNAVNTYNRYALEKQSSTITKSTIDISEVGAGDTFIFDKLDASAVTCTVTISISPNGTNETGSFTGVYLKDSNIELGDDGKFHTTNAVKITSASVNDNNKVAGLNDLDSNGKFEHYNIISSGYGTTHNGGFVTVIQYDNRGNVVAYASATLFSKNN